MLAASGIRRYSDAGIKLSSFGVRQIRSPTVRIALESFRYRILVVDDDELIRRVSGDVFSHVGYEVRTARDGLEGLASLRNAIPELIVSDLNMPRMSGFEFLSIVRRRFPQIAVICITGQYAAAKPEGLLCDAFFRKGHCRPEELLKQAGALLAEYPIRPSLPKPDKAPIWIPRISGSYVLTCTECLRPFSIPEDEAGDISSELPCLFCGARIRVLLEPKPCVPVVSPMPPMRAGKSRANSDELELREG
jgi:CheY-like chemotaxis protein